MIMMPKDLESCDSLLPSDSSITLTLCEFSKENRTNSLFLYHCISDQNQWRLVGEFTGRACYGSIKMGLFSVCLELEIQQFK